MDDEEELEMAARVRDPAAPKPEGGPMTPAVGEHLEVGDGVGWCLFGGWVFGNLWGAAVDVVVDVVIGLLLVAGDDLRVWRVYDFVTCEQVYVKSGLGMWSVGDFICLMCHCNCFLCRWPR